MICSTWKVLMTPPYCDQLSIGSFEYMERRLMGINEYLIYQSWALETANSEKDSVYLTTHFVKIECTEQYFQCLCRPITVP